MNINPSNLSKYIIKLSQNELEISYRKNPEQESVSIDPDLDLGKDRYFNKDRASIFKSIIEANFENIIKFLTNEKLINEIKDNDIQQTNPPHSFEYSNSNYIIKSTTLNQDGQQKKLTFEYIDEDGEKITIENNYNSQEHDIRIEFPDDTCAIDISQDSYCYLGIRNGDSFNHHIDIVKTPEGETYIDLQELVVSDDKKIEDKFDEILSVPIILSFSLQCSQTGCAAIYDMFKIKLDSYKEVHKNLSQYFQTNQY